MKFLILPKSIFGDFNCNDCGMHCWRFGFCDSKKRFM